MLGLVGRAGADTIRPLRLMTPDNLELAATYYPVSTNSAAAVVLLNSFGKAQDEWGTVPILFQRNGIAVLTFDFRGHGDSKRRLTANGVETVDYQKFTPQDYKSLLIDVNQAYDWLASQPGIDKHRIALIGSNIGAILALRYAAVNDDVAGLILLSPGLAFHDLRTDDAIAGFRLRPLRIVASREDAFANDSAKRLIEMRQHAGQAVESNELILCTGNLHGAAMLTGVPDLSSVVFAWLDRVLSGEPRPVPPPAPPGSVPATNKPAASPQRVERNYHS